MRELGWVEGETLTIDYAYGDGRPERMLELAVALANGPAQLVIASGSDAVVAARSAITQKPVVAVSTGAALGVGESLARRAGNFTGIALLFDQTAAKWVEMLSELLPRSSRLGVVHDSSVTNIEQFVTVQRTASALGYEAVPFRVESAHGLEQAIASTRQEKMAGLIFVSSPIFTADATRLAILVQATGLPAVFESRWIVEKGGLMSYG
ncbi:MAG TPA: ABC transporter substrate binding protein, partial [Beijerinckiaceae bacterium]|nr:ABC transporter substrate binding protein [Beijerinckiaceae bacterium]